jgi:hypothetical protein
MGRQNRRGDEVELNILRVVLHMHMTNVVRFVQLRYIQSFELFADYTSSPDDDFADRPGRIIGFSDHLRENQSTSWSVR